MIFVNARTYSYSQESDNDDNGVRDTDTDHCNHDDDKGNYDNSIYNDADTDIGKGSNEDYDDMLA